MPSILSRRALIVFLASLGAAAFAVAGVRAAEAPAFSSSWNLQQKQQFWEDRIGAIGPDDAYKEMISEAGKLRPKDRHLEAHIFGAAAYQRVGPGALGVCGDDFAFGCLHEVYKWIIAEEGTDALAHAYETYCLRGPDQKWQHQCSHAIGHGLLSNLGYTESALKDALDVCRASFYQDPINGCVGGVFMEYNLYTTLGPTIRAREVGDGDFHSVCRSVEVEFKHACYTWLPQWWTVYFSQHGMSKENIATRLGELCREDPSPYILDCFERAGQQIASLVASDPVLTKAYCAQAADTEAQRLSCISYAAWITTYADRSKLSDALEMCNAVESSDRAYCVSYATNERSKGNPLPQPGE